jgi:hypothetical protein
MMLLQLMLMLMGLSHHLVGGDLSVDRGLTNDVRSTLRLATGVSQS